MSNNNFFAYLGRMKYIERWSLMRNSVKENVAEHSCEVAMIAHALGTINNVVYGGNVSANDLCAAAIFHEASEVITGDLPTPIKYKNKKIESAYKELEASANEKLLTMMPNEFINVYRPIINCELGDYEKKLLKGADRLSALIKCIEEKKSGSKEFSKAEQMQRQALKELDLAEVEYFLDNFLKGYGLTLDEME